MQAGRDFFADGFGFREAFPMTTDLWMLVATALLCLVIPVVYAAGHLLQPGGLAWLAGNRESEQPVPAWTQRAVKAHANLVENLAPFAVFVLVVQSAGKADAASALGATIFFVGRVLHLVVYVTGVAYLRTLVWLGAWIGGAMVVAQLFK